MRLVRNFAFAVFAAGFIAGVYTQHLVSGWFA